MTITIHRDPFTTAASGLDSEITKRKDIGSGTMGQVWLRGKAYILYFLHCDGSGPGLEWPVGN